MATPLTAPHPEGARPPAVTVAVVAYQSGAYLQPCLDSLAAQSFGDFEAIVIDNASRDGSVEELRLPDARFRVEPMGANLGFAAGNNRAAEMARGAWLALLNPDAQAEPGWLEALMAATARWPRATSFGSTQLRLSDPTVLDGVGDAWHVAGLAWRAREGRSAKRIPAEGEAFGPCGAAALYRLDVFRGLGGFDETFFCYCEDVDYAYRARLAGHVAVQVPNAVVRHAGSGVSGRTSTFSLFHGHRNRVWTYFKNTPAPWLWLLLPYHLAFDVASVIAVIRHGRAWTVVKAHAAAFAGLPALWPERRRVQAGRRASIAALFGAMAWSPWSAKLREPVRVRFARSPERRPARAAKPATAGRARSSVGSA